MNIEKEKKAIKRLKVFEPEDGYYLAYSGGKDSDCIKILAQLAGVKFEAVHNLTTADAPETVQYVKSQKDVRIDLARDKEGNHITMWNLIVQKGMPPTRLVRYCCEKLKERGGKGRVVITGVRWDESGSRKQNSDVIKIIGKPKATQSAAYELGADYKIDKQGGLIMNDDNDRNRRMVEHCYRTAKTMVNPIVDWTTEEVWEFLSHYGCKANPLYRCGNTRVGCIGCPMAGAKRQIKEFANYPKFKQNYIKTFDKMLMVNRVKRKSPYTWKTGLDVYNWWVGIDTNQMTFWEGETNA